MGGNKDADECADEDKQVNAFFLRSLPRLARAYYDVSQLRSNFQKVIILAAATLNLWFWTTGVTSLQHAHDGCPTYVFLFSRTTITPAVRSIFITFAALYMAIHGIPYLLIFSRSCIQASTPRKIMVTAALDPRAPSDRGYPES